MKSTQIQNYQMLTRVVEFTTHNMSLFHKTSAVDIGESAEFQKARKRLSNAEEIIFLGFGYDETNLKRLFDGTELLPECVATGSFINLYPLEVAKIREAFQKLTARQGVTNGLNLLGAAEETTKTAIEFLRREIRFT